MDTPAALAEQFVGAAAAFLRDKYGELAAAKMDRETEITDGLAGAPRANLRGDVRDLEDGAADALRRRLERGAVWRHQRPGAVGAQDREVLDEALRFELGKLSTLLSRYGLIDRIAGGWGQWDSSGGWKSHKGEMMFAGPLEWSDEMEDLLRRYDAACTAG